jgi:hypothetical protein
MGGGFKFTVFSVAKRTVPGKAVTGTKQSSTLAGRITLADRDSFRRVRPRDHAAEGTAEAKIGIHTMSRAGTRMRCDGNNHRCAGRVHVDPTES